TLTTMAVLLPVVLLAGLAKKLFAPLALTVAVAMMASYLVSVCVTPVACRYFLGHATPGNFWGRIQRAIDRLADSYVRLLRRVLPFRRAVLLAAAALVLASAAIAVCLLLMFFFEIDESMDTLYVRFAPGTSLRDSAAALD